MISRTTEQFLALVEEKELMSPRAVAGLRAQIAQTTERASPQEVADRLVKRGHLTAAQAKRLLALAKRQREEKPRQTPNVEDEEEIGLAPLDDDPDERRAAAAKARKTSPKTVARSSGKPATEPTAVQPVPQASLFDQELSAATEAANPLTRPPRGGLWRAFARWPRRRKATQAEKWESSLMLVGGGGLLLLVLAMVFLVVALNRNKAEQMLKEAQDAYRAGDYLQAIHRYQEFVDKYPRKDGSSLARVRIGLAELRQATQSGNWPVALETAEKVVKRIAVEADFKEAHSELAAMLPTIGEGLAAEAKKKTDPALAAAARRTLAMTEKYVPRDLRPASRLKDIDDTLAMTDRDIARADELEKTLAVMSEAAKKSKTEDAYAACRALVHQYPDLADDAKLRKMLLDVSESQRMLVKTIAAKGPPAAAPEAPTSRGVTLARHELTAKAPDAEGQVAPVAVDGAIYGLDAATGHVLWRRFIGSNADPRAAAFPPTPISADSGADVLVVDAAKNRLLRLDAATGRTRWRADIGEPFDARPIVVGERVLIAARSGKLVHVAAASGQRLGGVQLPQPLAVAPAVDAGRSLLYQVAAHANLYILSLDDGACRQVVYLGHEPGTIVASPLVVDDYLVTAVNDGVRDCRLDVFLIQPKKAGQREPWLGLVQQVRLAGHVLTPPLADGRRILVTTSAGVVRMFELNAADAKSPLHDVAETAIDGGDNLLRFAMMRADQFWIADNRLTKYEVQAARGRLPPKWIAGEDSVYLAPPLAIGQAVVTVRRALGMPGATVSAVGMQDADKFWETQVAAPLAAGPLVVDRDGGRERAIVAVLANGGVFRLDPAGPAIVDRPTLAADVTRLARPVAGVVRLADGLLAISGGAGSDEIGVFDPRSPSPLLSWIKIPGKLACSPAAFAGGLLAPSVNGLVFLFDPRTGEPLAEPFQPRVRPGDEFQWMTPATTDANEAVLIDGKSKKMFCLELRREPAAHLAAKAEAVVTRPVVEPLAVLGKSAFLADADGGLNAFALPALARGAQPLLDSPCVWGPASVGDALLLATEDHRLLCFDAAGKRRWRVALDVGPLVGSPLRLGRRYVVVSQKGTILAVDAATGKVSGRIETSVPLGSGATSWGGQLIVAGHDGTLYVTPQP